MSINYFNVSNLNLIKFIEEHKDATIRSCSSHSNPAYYAEYENKIVFHWGNDPRYTILGLTQENIIKFRMLSSELLSNYCQLTDILKDIREGVFVSIEESIEEAL